MRSIELGLGHAAAKSKSLPIIGNQKFVFSVVAFTQCNHDIARPAVFPYIREPFLDDAHNFLTYARWQRYVSLSRFKTCRNTGFDPKFRYYFCQKVRQLLGAEVQRLCFLDQIAKIQGFLMNERLQPGQPPFQFTRRIWALSSENFDLHFRAEQ